MLDVIPEVGKQERRDEGIKEQGKRKISGRTTTQRVTG
jgi:hypothetical protein